MSIIGKQTQLGRSILEINSKTIKELFTLQRQNIETYFATNQTFGEKLPEVTDVPTFVSLQREYGEALWSNAKTAVETHGGIVRHAFEETRDAVKVAFGTEVPTISEPVEVEAVVKTDEPVAEAKVAA